MSVLPDTNHKDFAEKDSALRSALWKLRHDYHLEITEVDPVKLARGSPPPRSTFGTSSPM